MGWLDLIFPKRCVGCSSFGAYLCESCSLKIDYLQTQLCPECSKAAVFGATHPICLRKNGLDGLISLTNYKSPIRELLHHLKYKFVTDLLKEVDRKLKIKIELPQENWLLLPIPLVKTRENYRGFNQTAVLGKLVAGKLRLGFAEEILIRTRTSRPQVGLNRIERIKNVAEVFDVRQEVKDKSLIIFDDVWTSGATLKSAAFTLKKAGARKVWGLTLARPR